MVFTPRITRRGAVGVGERVAVLAVTRHSGHLRLHPEYRLEITEDRLLHQLDLLAELTQLRDGDGDLVIDHAGILPALFPALLLPALLFLLCLERLEFRAFLGCHLYVFCCHDYKIIIGFKLVLVLLRIKPPSGDDQHSGGVPALRSAPAAQSAFALMARSFLCRSSSSWWSSHANRLPVMRWSRQKASTALQSVVSIPSCCMRPQA